MRLTSNAEYDGEHQMKVEAEDAIEASQLARLALQTSAEGIQADLVFPIKGAPYLSLSFVKAKSNKRHANIISVGNRKIY